MQNRKLKELTKLKGNPRNIKSEDFKMLCQSLKDNPDYFNARPLVLSDRTGELVIIAGNQRYEAALKIGLKEVPTYLIKGLTEEREREIIIRDNISNGDWDYEILANEWSDEPLEDWGLIIDYPEEENKKAVDDGFEPEEIDHIKTNIKTGDLIEIGPHKLLCGDSSDITNIETLLNGNKVDLVFTDPPYRYKKMGAATGDFKGMDSNYKDRIKGIVDFDPQGFLKLLPSVFSKNMNTYIFCNTDLVPDYCLWAKSNKYNFNILTWHKKRILPFSSNHHLADTEYLIYISKKAIFNCSIEGVSYGKYWILDSELSKDHPTIKPIEIISNEIKISSNKNSIVFDFFNGSGSTMMAAHQLERICYAMEMEPKYCQVCVNRMMKFDENLIVKINGNIYKNENPKIDF